jgi:hypothetical protein
MAIRLQPLLWLLVCCACLVFGRAEANLQFTLYHQLAHSESAKDITPRGVIKYDPLHKSAIYEAQSDVANFASSKGVYRIGLYDSNKQRLSPAAFTKLV